MCKKQKRRIFSQRTRKCWKQPVHAKRRVLGIKGEIADAISYALCWYERVYGTNNGFFLSKNGAAQAVIHNGGYAILNKGWGMSAPSWLIGQATRYLASRHVHVTKQTECQIHEHLRNAHTRWVRAVKRQRQQRRHATVA